MNRVMKVVKPVSKFFKDTWLGKTISLTLVVLLGALYLSWAQARAIDKGYEKIQAQYAQMNCINVWKQMKKGDEI